MRNMIQLAKCGDPSALEELILIHQDRILRLTVHLLGNTEEAKDAAQEILLRFCRGIESTTIKMSGNFPLKAKTGSEAVNFPQSVDDISSYTLEVMFRVTPIEQDKVISIKPLDYRIKIPIKNQGKIEFVDSVISTSLDLHEGQMAVVGKTSVAGLPAENIILVISAVMIN